MLAKPSLLAIRGNAITEYTVIGSLLLICMAAFGLIGSDLKGYFSGLKEDMLSHTQAAAQSNQKIINAQAQIKAQAQESANLGRDASYQELTSNSTIETVGANGNTKAHANDILTKAKQALASGSLTQEEYDVVARLANKGHDIAMIQGLLEYAYKQSNGNSSAYANSSLTFNGQSYTPSQLNSILKSNIADFSTLRSQASTQRGVLYNQALLGAINDSGGQIINNGYSSQQQNQTADSFIQYQNAGLGGGSADTHQESAVICTKGEHLDVNNQCVP